MNIERAKLVPLTTILNRMGVEPVRERTDDIWYKSPIRQENTASFHIKLSENVWYDHGIAEGGDSVSLVCAYLKYTREDHTIADALRWLRNMTGDNVIPIHHASIIRTKKTSWKVKTVKPLRHLALIRYVENRCIKPALAREYFQEVYAQHNETGKGILALGLINEEEGYELRNSFFKGSAGKKSISFIRGSVVKPNGIHLFEGMMDYLSCLSYLKLNRLEQDTIVLNSLSCLKTAIPYIKNYGYSIINTWFDNDEAGQRGVSSLLGFLAEEQNLIHKPMNDLYRPYKDVNEWHIKKCMTNNQSLKPGS